jgi:hypothetical protein
VAELLNCPFCGSKVVETEEGFNHPRNKECFLWMVNPSITEANLEEYKEKLYKAWNTRIKPDA